MNEMWKVNTIKLHPLAERNLDDPENPESNVVNVSKRLLGYGNENAVRPLLRFFGDSVSRSVGKIKNNAFFRWQKKGYADMLRYLHALDDEEIHVSKSTELVEEPEIWYTRDCTRWELFKNLLSHTSIGKFLKLITKQPFVKREHVIIEDERYPDPLKISALENPEWLGKEVFTTLEKGERILEKHGLFIDPLGGSAISAALKFLGNPTGDLIMSNFELEEVDDEDPAAGQRMILADFGLMDVGNPHGPYGIPCTGWIMKVVLGFLGHLTFEAMNMTLRQYGYDEAPFNLQPRPLRLGNAIPKGVSWVACNAVWQAERHWYHGEKNIASWVYALGQSVSHLG